MSQSSRCKRCDRSIEASFVEEGRANYRCYCGNKWSGKAYYGKDRTSTGIIVGGIIGTALGGIGGGVIGTVIGAISAHDSCTCLKCGGTGYPTGRSGNRKGYQCSGCKSFWTKRA